MLNTVTLRRLGLRNLLFVALISTTAWVYLPDLLFHPTLDLDYGIVPDLTASSRLAIATFLSGDPDVADTNDDYFRAARLMTYQLRHAPDTRSRDDIPFIVLVTTDVPAWKRNQLSKDGAIVIEAEDVPLSWWIGTGVTRWRDQFTKLRLLQMIEYERILFVDADTLITKPLDGVFEEPGVRHPARSQLVERRGKVRWDEAKMPATYVFGARSDNQFLGERSHVFPPGHTDVFTAGFWVAAPSPELYEYLMSVMAHWRRFDPHTMEQSLLNYAFRRAGAMPWTELNARWSATWPNKEDLEAGVASLHEKFWKTGPKALRKLYLAKRDEAEGFYAEREKQGG